MADKKQLDLTHPFSIGRELNDQRQRVGYARQPMTLNDCRPLPDKLRLDLGKALENLIKKAGG
jgi:hypothetical protein